MAEQVYDNVMSNDICFGGGLESNQKEHVTGENACPMVNSQCETYQVSSGSNYSLFEYC